MNILGLSAHHHDSASCLLAVIAKQSVLSLVISCDFRCDFRDMGAHLVPPFSPIML